MIIACPAYRLPAGRQAVGRKIKLMITFDKVTKIYPAYKNKKETVVLDDVSFQIKAGEFICVVGRSGAGKTTLIKLLLREEEPTKGKIIFDNVDIATIKDRKLYKLRRRMGVVFQDYKLLTSKTVYENISYGMEVTGASEEEIKKDVPEILDIVDLAKQADRFPSQLSGGEKQRVAIARALIHDPDVILADEPTGDLDPYHSKNIVNLLRKINHSGTTIVLATHDKEIVNYLDTRVVTLRNTKVISDVHNGRFRL